MSDGYITNLRETAGKVAIRDTVHRHVSNQTWHVPPSHSNPVATQEPVVVHCRRALWVEQAVLLVYRSPAHHRWMVDLRHGMADARAIFAIPIKAYAGAPSGE